MADAAEVGERHGYGQVSAVFRQQEDDPVRGLLLGVAALLVLAALTTALAGSPGWSAALVAAALLLLALPLRRRPQASWAYLFEHGLVMLDRRGRPTAIRWSDVVGADFVWAYRDSDQDVRPQSASIAGFSLRTARSGDVVLRRTSGLAHDPSPAAGALPELVPPGRDAQSVAGPAALPQALEAAVVGALARRALARCDADGHVDFGTVRLTADALTVDGRTPVAWRELTSCDIDGWTLQVRGRFGLRTTRNVRLDEVPDAWVLVQAVVQRLVEQRG